MENPLTIAMWSGPRNISTAMMRSWGNRTDTFVCDEPFYAHYLHATGREHPGRDEVIASGEIDWRKVVEQITGPVPQGKAVFFQKHMAQHLLPHIERGWLDRLAHLFLIREPREMLTSFIRNVPDAVLADTGLPQQVEIFELVRGRTGRVPPVVDSRDVLENPRRVVGLLCEALGVGFTEAMLSWPPDRRETDGVWAKHWYAAVEQSTCFSPYRAKPDLVPESMRGLYDECLEYYHRLHRHRLV